MYLNELSTILKLVIYQFGLIFPYWIIGILAGSIISVFAKSKISKLAGMLSGGHSIIAIIAAALLGAASPVCMYGTVPLIASFGKKGVPQHLLATFMISSILINPNLFLFSFALGAPVALLRLFISLLAGILAGFLVKFLFKNKSLFNYNGFKATGGKNTCSNPALNFLGDMNRAVLKTAPYFLAGIMLAALFDCYFPKELIVNLFGKNAAFGVLLSASLGVPVYICGGGTIPLIRAWMNAGMSTGSAMAFMITGPATKLTNLGAVKIILGSGNFFLYIAFNMLFALITGSLIDLINSIHI